jgi:hypothetical protein
MARSTPFTNYNGTTVGRFVRVETNGVIDAAFAAANGKGADGPVYSLGLEPAGDIVLGGDFKTVNGVARAGVALIFGDAPLVRFVAQQTVTNGYQLTLVSQPGAYAVDFTTDLLNWTPLGTNVALSTTLIFTDATAPVPNERFYRARLLVP